MIGTESTWVSAVDQHATTCSIIQQCAQPLDLEGKKLRMPLDVDVPDDYMPCLARASLITWRRATKDPTPIFSVQCWFGIGGSGGGPWSSSKISSARPSNPSVLAFFSQVSSLTGSGEELSEGTERKWNSMYTV